MALRLPRSFLVRVAGLIPVVVLLQPWAIFIEVLCIISGISALIGPEPGAIASILPRLLVLAWQVTLVGGAALGLYGLLRPHPTLEITGNIWLGTAALVYAGAILTRAGLAGIIAGSIVAAFGLAALIRALALHVAGELMHRRIGGRLV